MNATKTVTTTTDSKTRQSSAHAPGEKLQGGSLDPALLLKALPDTMRKLDPRTLWRNPVMFIVEIGAVWSTILAFSEASWFSWLTVFWLWLTVIFANLAEAVAEGRGKAQADALRKSKSDAVAHRLRDWTPRSRDAAESEPVFEEVAAPLLQQGDFVVV